MEFSNFEFQCVVSNFRIFECFLFFRIFEFLNFNFLNFRIFEFLNFRVFFIFLNFRIFEFSNFRGNPCRTHGIGTSQKKMPQYIYYNVT